MKCFRAPPAPTLRQKSADTPPLSQTGTYVRRNPIAWEEPIEKVPKFTKARVTQDIGDTRYFDERPRGLAKAQFSVRSVPSIALAGPPETNTPPQKVVEYPFPVQYSRPSRKRFLQYSRPRNPILQDDPSFEQPLPRARNIQDWRPSTTTEVTNLKRSGFTSDLWAAPRRPGHSKSTIFDLPEDRGQKSIEPMAWRYPYARPFEEEAGRRQ